MRLLLNLVAGAILAVPGLGPAAAQTPRAPSELVESIQSDLQQTETDRASARLAAAGAKWPGDPALAVLGAWAELQRIWFLDPLMLLEEVDPMAEIAPRLRTVALAEPELRPWIADVVYGAVLMHLESYADQDKTIVLDDFALFSRAEGDGRHPWSGLLPGTAFAIAGRYDAALHRGDRYFLIEGGREAGNFVPEARGWSLLQLATACDPDVVPRWESTIQEVVDRFGALGRYTSAMQTAACAGILPRTMGDFFVAALPQAAGRGRNHVRALMIAFGYWTERFPAHLQAWKVVDPISLVQVLSTFERKGPATEFMTILGCAGLQSINEVTYFVELRATWDEAKAAMRSARYQDAARGLRKVVRRARVLSLSGVQKEAWNDLGLALFHAGSIAEAESAFERALELARRLSGANSMDVAVVLGNLASVARKRGETGSALDFLDRCLEILRQHLEAGDPLIVECARNLVGLLEAEDAREAADGLLEIVLEDITDPSHPARIPLLFEQARIRHRSGPRAAAALMADALGVSEACFGAGHSQHAVNVLDAARIALARGADKVEPLVESALRGLSLSDLTKEARKEARSRVERALEQLLSELPGERRATLKRRARALGYVMNEMR